MSSPPPLIRDKRDHQAEPLNDQHRETAQLNQQPDSSQLSHTEHTDTNKSVNLSTTKVEEPADEETSREVASQCTDAVTRNGSAPEQHVSEHGDGSKNERPTIPCEANGQSYEPPPFELGHTNDVPPLEAVDQAVCSQAEAAGVEVVEDRNEHSSVPQLPEIPKPPPEFLLPSDSFPNDQFCSDFTDTKDEDALHITESEQMQTFTSIEAADQSGALLSSHQEGRLNGNEGNPPERGRVDHQQVGEEQTMEVNAETPIPQSQETLQTTQGVSSGGAPFPSFGGFAWATASSLISAASNMKKEPRLLNLSARLSEMIQSGEEETMEGVSTGEMQAVEPLSKEADRQLQTIDRLATQIIAAEENLATSRDNEDKLREECHRLKSELKKKETECNKLFTQIEDSTNKARQAVRDELQKELETLIAERDQKIRALQTDLAQTTNSVFALQDQCGRLSESEAVLMERLKMKEVENSDLNIKLESVQTELMMRRDAADNIDNQSATSLQTLKEQNLSYETQVKMARQQIDQLSNHVKVREMENEQLTSALNVMKEKLKSLDMLKQRVLSLPDSQLTPDERNALSQCATADDVLLLLKSTNQEVETYKQRLAGAAQTLATLTNKLQETKTALQESQTENEKLRSLRTVASTKAETSVDGVETSMMDAKMQQQSVAALEARLQARTERVQTLVAELAAVRAQLDEVKGPSSSQVQVFHDDGRRSWCRAMCLAPLASLTGRLLGKKWSRALQKISSKHATTFMQTKFIATVDRHLRNATRLMTSSKDGLLLIALYMIALHAAFFFTVIAT